MGQAKTRGSFEQRKALAIARAEAEAIERQRVRDEQRKAEKALPREQLERLRASRFKASLLLAAFAGLTASQGANHD